MWATVRRFVTARWLLAHALILGAAVTMVLLGRWQLDVSNARHFDLQNFGYALQWWAFTLFALFLWARSIRDTLRKRPPVPSTSGELVLRGGPGAVAVVGPAELVSRARDGAEPVRYRGYVMPQSSQIPARSGGDPHHGAYNDYLWQLALADGAVGGGATPAGAAPAPADPNDADPDDPRPARPELTEQSRPELPSA